MRRMIPVGDVELSVHDTEGDGPAAVLLLGLAGHGEEWSGTRRAPEAAHRVVTLDQRGHGQGSRRPDDVSRAAYVLDVVVGAIPESVLVETVDTSYDLVVATLPTSKRP